MLDRSVALVAMALLAACSRNDPPVERVVADSTPLTRTEWRLAEMYGAPAPLGAGDRAATLVLDPVEGRASGFGGCNRYAGTYTRSRDSLTFGPLMMTRMACDKGNDLEVRHADALRTVRRFRIAGEHLELLAGDSVVARYVRVRAS